MTETREDRLERYRIEGAVDFIGGIIKGAKERDDAGLLLCGENAEKALRRLRIDKATLRSEVAELRSLLNAVLSAYEHGDPDMPFAKEAKAITSRGRTT